MYDDMGYCMVRVTDLKEGYLNLRNTLKVSKEVFEEFTKKYLPAKEDILMTRVGTYGVCSFVKTSEKFCLGQNTVVINPKHSKPFLYYSLISPFIKNQIEEKVVGSPQKTISLKSIKELNIPFPPLPEQKAIAATLSALDDKIELNNRINKTLEEMAQAIFKSWFVDFEPFQDGEFEDSELGMIPKGWRIGSFLEMIEINPKRILNKGTIAPYLEMKNIPSFSARVYDWTDRELTSGTKFENGDVLLARITPCLENGKTVYVDFLETNQIGWGSTEFIVFRSRKNIPKEFAYFLARSDRFRAHAISNMSGSSGRQRVPEGCFAQYLLVVPPIDELNKFGAIALSMMKLMKKHDEESKALSEIRNALLPILMSGEIRVPVEKEVI